MSIRPIDTQTTVMGANQVSNQKGKADSIQHSNIQAQGTVDELDRESLEKVNATEDTEALDPDAQKEKEQEEKERQEKEAAAEESKKATKPVSDGIRGRRFDFKV